MYLLLNATHKESPAIFNKKKIILKKGQLITGRKAIAEKFDISESKVQRILKTFEIEQQIEQQTCSQNRLISIINWNEYQQNEQQVEQQVNSERTTNEQQMNTNNNDNNIYIYLYTIPRSHARLLYIIKHLLSTLFLYFFHFLFSIFYHKVNILLFIIFYDIIINAA